MLATKERSWTSVVRVSRTVAIWTLVGREMQRRGRSICFQMDRVEILARVMGGKPSARRPRFAAVSRKSETKWLRLPVAGRERAQLGLCFSGGRLPRGDGRPCLRMWLGTRSPSKGEEECVG